MPQEQWSDDEPREVGWYWWRGSQEAKDDTIVRVENWNGRWFCVIGRESEPVSSCGGEWAGPILTPEQLAPLMPFTVTINPA